MLTKRLQTNLGKTKGTPKEETVDENPLIQEIFIDIAIEKSKEWLDNNKPDFISAVKEEASTIISNEITSLRENELHNIKKGDKGEASTVPGPKGDSIVGPQGPKGDSIVGPMGPQGPKGDSIVGPQGPEGKSIIGPAGKDGSPDKPEDIVSKLNTTDGKVKQTVVEGLVEDLKNLKDFLTRKIQTGGGDIVEAGADISVTRVNGKKVIAYTGTGGSGVSESLAIAYAIAL